VCALCVCNLTQKGDEKLLRKLEHFQEKLDGMDEEAKKQILHDKAVHAALLRAQGCVNFLLLSLLFLHFYCLPALKQVIMSRSPLCRTNLSHISSPISSSCIAKTFFISGASACVLSFFLSFSLSLSLSPKSFQPHRVKVKDDPKLLRKTLKREEKKKAKSAKTWYVNW
jgi:hypothetical protein